MRREDNDRAFDGSIVSLRRLRVHASTEFPVAPEAHMAARDNPKALGTFEPLPTNASFKMRLTPLCPAAGRRRSDHTLQPARVMSHTRVASAEEFEKLYKLGSELGRGR